MEFDTQEKALRYLFDAPFNGAEAHMPKMPPKIVAKLGQGGNEAKQILDRKIDE